MNKKRIEEVWEEIIATANNQDPKYSFELFEGTLKDLQEAYNIAMKENNRLRKKLEETK